DMGITVIHRSDGSGTTFILSEYLSKANQEWRKRIGFGKSLRWPVGRKARGNPGVAGLVNQISGSIGYVELVYALGNNMAIGAVKNRSGRFVAPSTESVSLAARVDLPEHSEPSLTDTSSAEGYPISGFTWLLVYTEQNYLGRSRERAEDLAELLWWVTHDGQDHTTTLHYAPLPEEAVKQAEELLKTLTHNGSPLLQ
ncbi:MAG: phosphate ABC transporter substrate-binding protein PstS, partial [Desulfobacteraceae bacterium]